MCSAAYPMSDYQHTLLHTPSVQSYHSPFSPHGWTTGEYLHQYFRPPTHFDTQQNSLISASGTLSILLIPSEPLSLSIWKALILDLCSFHIIVSMPYIGTNTSCKSLALTKDLIAPATLLLLPTFLQPSTLSILQSSKTHPKHLNSDTCSDRTPSTLASHSCPFSTTTLLLPGLILRL